MPPGSTPRGCAPPGFAPPGSARPGSARPGFAPPGPAGRRPGSPTPPPTTRPRRRWGRRFGLLTLLGIVCCCGLPVAYFVWPPARQYPVKAALPATVADLSLRDDSASQRAVARLTQQLGGAKVDQVFAGIYGDDNGKRVTIFGTTGFRLTPGSDVTAELRRLSDQYDIHDVQPYRLGETGAYERCGIGDNGDATVVVCTWADHGSLVTVVMNRRSRADSAALTALLRSAVLKR